MPVYRNKKTGVEFISPCECKGADIVSVPSTYEREKERTAPERKPARKKTSEK